MESFWSPWLPCMSRFLEFSLRQGIVPKVLGWGHKWAGPMTKVKPIYIVRNH